MQRDNRQREARSCTSSEKAPNVLKQNRLPYFFKQFHRKSRSFQNGFIKLTASPICLKKVWQYDNMTHMTQYRYLAASSIEPIHNEWIYEQFYLTVFAEKLSFFIAEEVVNI